MKRASKPSPPEAARLFSDERPVAPASGLHTANIDGASRGNPGPAAYAVVFRDPAGHVILELAKRLGRETNNVAEYYALLAALDYAIGQGIGALRIRSDSELLVRQMQGRYKVKSLDLRPLYERASKLSRQLGYFAIEHVRREQNRDADALANVALDSGSVSNEPARGTKPEARVLGEVGSKATTRRIHARFANGVLVPSEPLDLAENSDVFLEVRISKHA
ncbi:MAG TPA: ribonuclease HI family protein [Candidatus Acidoferrales bacterium]|nr:ribonuclease HI family protein [Candidatus Acidoferrales bacterium]